MVQLPAFSRQQCMHCPASPTLVVSVMVVGRLLIDSAACNAAALPGAAEQCVIVACDTLEECR